jgi:hypothetical protein
MIDIEKYKTESTRRFLRWDDASKEEPFLIQIIGEPRAAEFRGKTRFDVPVLHGTAEQVLTCSQAAINALVDAYAYARKSDKNLILEEVLWAVYREGEGYDIRYHWIYKDKAPPF